MPGPRLDMSPDFSVDNFIDMALMYVWKHRDQLGNRCSTSMKASHFKDIGVAGLASGTVLAAFGGTAGIMESGPDRVLSVLFCSDVFKVDSPVVSLDPVDMVNLETFRARTNESQGDEFLHLEMPSCAISIEINKQISLARMRGRAQESLPDWLWVPIEACDNTSVATDSALVADGVKSFVPWDGAPFFGGNIEFSHAHLRECGQEPGARSNGSGSAYFSTGAN